MHVQTSKQIEDALITPRINSRGRFTRGMVCLACKISMTVKIALILQCSSNRMLRPLLLN